MPVPDPAARRAEVERRLAVNETAHRRVNEAIERGTGREPLQVRCECGHLGCTAMVELAQAEYEAVRTSFERFLVLPGHEEPNDEVVEDHGRYLVVHKHGTSSEVARQDDPRPDATEAEPT